MPAISNFVSDVTQDRFVPKVVDNVYSGNVLTMILSKNPRTWRGGTKIQQPVYLAPVTTVGSYFGFDTFNTTQETKTQLASFDPSQYYASVQISGIQRALNQGDAAVIDLIASEMDITAEGLRQTMGDDVYGDGTNNSSKALLGLQAAVDDSTSVTTYGGLSRATYTNWRATRTAQSGSLSIANLAADFDAAQVGNETPDLIVTTPSVFTIYEALLTPTVSHQFSMNDFRMTGEGMAKVGGTIAANQGFRALTFRGTPVVADEKCTAGNIYTLNTRHLTWWTIPQPTEFGRTENRGFGWTGWKEPVNQDAIAGQLLAYCQLTTDSPRLHARRTGVTS